jgi:hypothetical protein
MTVIPDFLLTRATSRGISEPEALELWRAHTAWCDQNAKDYGGRLWDTLLDKVVERVNGQTRIGEADQLRAQETARRVAEERKAKDARDAEYALQAVNLRDWVASLRAQVAAGELLEPHEATLASGDLPQGHEDAASFLMASLGDVRTFDGRVPTRPNPCGHPGCGLPVRQWAGLGGRRYASGRCVDHESEVQR